MKIIISHDRPPVPSTSYDYSAVTEDYEPGAPLGHGRTARDAVEDLLDQMDMPSKRQMVSVSYLVATGGSGLTRIYMDELPEWLKAEAGRMVIKLEVV